MWIETPKPKNDPSLGSNDLLFNSQDNNTSSLWSMMRDPNNDSTFEKAGHRPFTPPDDSSDAVWTVKPNFYKDTSLENNAFRQSHNLANNNDAIWAQTPNYNDISLESSGYDQFGNQDDVMWDLIPNFTSNTSLENEGIRQFGTHGNNTVFYQYPPELMDFAAACFIIFALIGVTGNFISILALSKSRRLRNATTAFVVNLCVADLLFCGFSMPMSALTFLERDWNYGEVLCKLFPLVRYSNGAVSLFSVIAITINRYVLIVHPSIYRAMYRPINIAVMIGLIWVSALVLLLFPLVEIWGRLGYDPKVGTCTILKLNGKSPKMVMYITAFAVPSLVFVLCYSRIFCVVRRSSKRSQKDVPTSIRGVVTFSSKKGIVFKKTYKHSEMTSDPIKRKQKELKVLRVLMVIFVTFILCYFPVSFVKIFKKEDDLPILNIVGYLGIYFSNIINPIIYVAMSEEYRKAYVELFCSKPQKSGSTETI